MLAALAARAPTTLDVVLERTGFFAWWPQSLRLQATRLEVRPHALEIPGLTKFSESSSPTWGMWGSLFGGASHGVLEMSFSVLRTSLAQAGLQPLFRVWGSGCPPLWGPGALTQALPQAGGPSCHQARADTQPQRASGLTWTPAGPFTAEAPGGCACLSHRTVPAAPLASTGQSQLLPWP